MPTRKSHFPDHHPILCSLERRRIFIPAFTLLCTAFVPTLLSLLSASATLPLSALLVLCHSEDREILAIVTLIHLLIYTGIGWCIHHDAMEIRRRSLRHGILILFLLIPISCSFARILNDGDIGRSENTYTFWEAVDRYYEKQQLQHIR